MSAPRRSRPRGALALAIALGALLVAPRPAAADITLGVFAPAARFTSMQARIDLGERLAAHLESASPGERIRSRVYARAADFEEAVSGGKIALALVDATYLVHGKVTPQVLAAAPYVKWDLMSRRYKSVAELRGKRLSVAAGGQERRLVDGLFEGEARQLFPGDEHLSVAQDSASALAALSVDKADAALLPTSESDPSDVRLLLDFPAMPGLLLVAYPQVKPDAYERITSAAAQFRGEGPVPLLRAAGNDVLETVRQRLTVAPRRAPLPTLPLRALIDALITAPVLTIPQRAAQDFAISPVGGAPPVLATPIRSAPPAAPAPTAPR